MNKLYFILLLLVLASCDSKSRIKDGLTAYELKQYANAKELLEEEFSKSTSKEEKAQKAYLLGNTATFLLDDIEALKWYKQAVELEHGEDAILKLAYQYKKNENYGAAIATFQRLASNLVLKEEIRRQVQICQEMEKSLTVEGMTILPFLEEGYYSDYSPAIYDRDYLVFTSDREGTTGNDTYNWTGNSYTDLYIVSKSGGKPVRFDALINTKYNDGTACFSRDNSEMYFTRCFSFSGEGDEKCKLMKSVRIDGIWSEPSPLPFIKNDINYGQPCLIEGDSVLVFSRMSDGNVTGYDLWYSERLDDGTWSEAFIMPKSINTDGNEYFPTADGDTLYFSSDYHPGYGGLDIFKTGLNQSGSWSKPLNVGYGINSGSDDFGLIIVKPNRERTNLSKSGYFTSSRTKNGRDGLYYFESKKTEDKILDPTLAEKIEEKDYTVYLAVKVAAPIYEKADDPNTRIVGRNAIRLAKVTLKFDGKQDTSFFTDKNGFAIVSIPKDANGIIQASAPDFLTNQTVVAIAEIDMSDEKETYTINKEILLDKILRGKEILLDNIFYDYNEFFIREDAKPSLNNLVQILKNNPEIKIELGSHTDCRGEDDYNMTLSQKRAQSAITYLIAQGIANERLTPKGYGETRPAVICKCEQCSESEHQANRRTTFKIL